MSDRLESMSEIEALRNLPGLMADELADHARTIAAKDAEIEHLRKALKEIGQHAADMPGKVNFPDLAGFKPRWFQMGWVQGRLALADIALKALSEVK